MPESRLRILRQSLPSKLTSRWASQTHNVRHSERWSALAPSVNGLCNRDGAAPRSIKQSVSRNTLQFAGVLATDNRPSHCSRLTAGDNNIQVITPSL